VITFILVLLLLAALFGVLGVVLKVTLVIVLSTLLTIAVVSAFGYYWLRYRLNRFRRDVERANEQDRWQQRRSLPPGA
jgi:hypothetical protein